MEMEKQRFSAMAFLLLLIPSETLMRTKQTQPSTETDVDDPDH